MGFTEYRNKETIHAVNALLSNEEYCKQLLGLYLNTTSKDTINRYYEKYEALRERGHFDPQIEGGGYSWNWAAFCFGPFFFWYRKQYMYMAGIIVTMFFFFFPGFILAGFIANMPILNDFALAVAKGMDRVYRHEKVVRKLESLEKSGNSEAYMNYFNENVCPLIEKECVRRGGTNMFAYVIPVGIIVLIVVLHLIFEL